MLIDRKHIGWGVATAVLALASTGVYLWDAPHHLRGPSGSTVVGLSMGIAAYAIMLHSATNTVKERSLRICYISSIQVF